MVFDIGEVIKTLIDGYGPSTALLVAGMFLLYRQNVELSQRLDKVTERFIELSQKSVDINRQHADAINDLQDKIVLYYVRRNIPDEDLE